MRPDPYDFFQKRNRKAPLKIKLFKADILEKCKELKELNYDAVTLIEVIEHVYLNELGLLENNVFEFLNPRLVVITTPNYDFNEFFK